MSDTVIRMWCEWSLGQEDFVFTTEAKAIAWMEEALAEAGIGDPIDELIAEGLLGFETLEVK